MSEEKEVVSHVFHWTDSMMWTVVALFIAGTIGRILASGEPFNARKFAGEIILSGLGGVLLYSVNLMQGMSIPQMMFFGALGGLGGVRLIEWLIKIAKKVRSAGIL